MILEGKTLAKDIKENLKQEIIDNNLKLKFVIMQIGEDAASDLYIKMKIKYTQDLGIDSEYVQYKDDVDEDKVYEDILKLNKDESVNGIILQLPLPAKFDDDRLLQAIDPQKDIDGLTEINMGKAYYNKPGHYSATAVGVIRMLEYYNIDIEGKNIVMAGSSNLIGKVLSLLLINRGATVTTCNSHTKDIKQFIDTADIFISAIGVGNNFDASFFENKQDLVVIDVGTNFIDGKLVGDVKYDEVEPLVKDITPVPGGVGALTISELITNLVNTKLM